LEDSLNKKIKVDRKNDRLLVLGIPRCGIVVADTVASKLPYQCELDIIVPRKLTAPGNQEIAIGAIMMDEEGDSTTSYLNDELIKELEISQDYIEKEKTSQVEEIKRRKSLYRDLEKRYDIEDRIVIVVDDGAATGATLIAAARWIKKDKEKPKNLIIAIPVTSKDTVNMLNKECDMVVTGTTASSASTFKSVGQYYQEFKPVEDYKVVEICKRNNLLSL
jgi:putative phosphoribosyl transferase